MKRKPGNPFLLVSPDGRDGSLSINQNAFISRITLEAGNSLDYKLYSEENGLFIMVIEGKAKIAGKTLGKRDALTVKEVNQIVIDAPEQLDILLLEVPV